MRKNNYYQQKAEYYRQKTIHILNSCLKEGKITKEQHGEILPLLESL